MSLNILQSKSCSGTCTNCPRTAKRRSSCDPNSACPGYGTSDSCPPLIVLAVHEYLQAALQLASSNLPDLPNLRTVPA